MILVLNVNVCNRCVCGECC